MRGRRYSAGANALVAVNTIIPQGSLVPGSPAKVVRKLTDEEVERSRAIATHHVRRSRICLGIEIPAANPLYVDERGG